MAMEIFDLSALHKLDMLYKTPIVEVYSATYYMQLVSCKCLKVDARGLKNVEKEIEVLKMLRHPNIPRFYWVGLIDDEIMIAQELLI